jgi:hypothetical protein
MANMVYAMSVVYVLGESKPWIWTNRSGGVIVGYLPCVW